MTGFLAILKNVVNTTRRERTALIFTLLLPIFLMGLFGSIFSGSGPKLTVGIVDQDRSALSAQLIRVLRSEPGLDVEIGSRTHELDRLRHDDVVLVTTIPSGFQRALAGRRTAVRVNTYQDLNQLQSSALAQGAVVQTIDSLALASNGHAPPVVIASSKVATTNVTTLDFYLASMIAYIVLIAGIQSVAISLVDLRERRVLRRFQATPLSAMQILGGQIAGHAVTVVLQVLVLIGVGVFIFQARTHGSWLLAGLTIALGIACFISIGFLVTGFVRTSEAARGVASAITFPMMFLSGIFIPLASLPPTLRNVVHVLPLTYLSDALHRVLNDGTGLNAIWIDLLVVAAWTGACFGIAARRFRWE